MKAMIKCGDYYYAQKDKRSAMAYYERSAELGDPSAKINIALMLEAGYDTVLPQPEKAI